MTQSTSPRPPAQPIASVSMEMRVVTFGSLMEETPEGFYYAEKLRRADERLLSLLSPAGLRKVREAEIEFERRILYG